MKTKENLIKKIIDATRRGEKAATIQIVDLLKNESKGIYLKNLYFLKEKGFNKDYVDSLYFSFIMEFLTRLEFDKHSILNYYRGFIKNKFSEVSKKTYSLDFKIISQSVSIDSKIGDGEIILGDVLSSNEDIREWYNSQELINRYVYSSSPTLNKAEKEIIALKLEGYKFVEISSLLILPYTQILTIYNLALDKIRKKEAELTKETRKTYAAKLAKKRKKSTNSK